MQIANALQNAANSGENVELLPTTTSHRTAPAVVEKVTVSTPDDSLTVNPCIMRSGYCN